MTKRRTKARTNKERMDALKRVHILKLREWKESGGADFPPLPKEAYPQLSFVLQSFGLPVEMAQIPPTSEERRRWTARLRYRWNQDQLGVKPRKPFKEAADPETALMRRLIRERLRSNG